MKKNYLILIPIFFLCIIILLLYTNHIAFIDNAFYKLIVHNDPITSILKCITNFGSVAYIIAICILLFLFYKNKKDLYKLYSITIISTLINNIIKCIIQRPRPNLVHLVVENSTSFPSGHAMAAMTFYGYLIYMIWRNKMNKKWKIILTMLLSTLILMICFSRVYLNVHYFSDVLAGLLFSIIILYLFILETKKA